MEVLYPDAGIRVVHAGGFGGMVTPLVMA